MEMHQLVIHFLIVVTQALAGVFSNGIIMVVNVIDFFNHRQMAPLDLLLSCLVTSRICIQYILIVHLILLSFMKQSVLVK